MAERENYEAEKVVEEVVREFAAERGRRELRWREGGVLKEIKISTSWWEAVEVLVELTETSGWRGRPAPGGAWCGWRLGGVSHRGLRKGIGLHTTRDLQLEVRRRAPELHPVVPERTVGRVRLDDPALEARVLALIDEAWSELEPLGEEDLARARQESAYVVEHSSWWQRRRDHQARVARVRALDPLLKEFADSLGGRFRKDGDYEPHLLWPRRRARARISLSPSEFAEDAGYLQVVQLNYQRKETSGRRRGQWRSLGGVGRVVLGGWDDIEGLRSGFAWLRDIHELIERAETWAEDRGLTPRWEWRGSPADWVVRWPQADPRFLVGVHAHPESGLWLEGEARQKEALPGSALVVQWVARRDAKPEPLAEWLDVAGLRAALEGAGRALEGEDP